MRVFVAGAAGAIGQQLLPQLAAQGHQVTAATRARLAARVAELAAGVPRRAGGARCWVGGRQG